MWCFPHLHTPFCLLQSSQPPNQATFTLPNLPRPPSLIVSNNIVIHCMIHFPSWISAFLWAKARALPLTSLLGTSDMSSVIFIPGCSMIPQVESISFSNCVHRVHDSNIQVTDSFSLEEFPQQHQSQKYSTPVLIIGPF